MTALVDLALEAALLGGLLLDPVRVVAVRRLLPDPAAFAAPAHRAVYRALLAVLDQGAHPDPASMRHALLGVPESDAVGEDLFGDLVDGVTSGANAVPHATALRDLWQRRLVITRAITTIAAAEDRAIPLRQTVAESVAGLAAAGLASTRPLLTMGQGLWEVMEDLERQATTGDVVGVSSGLPDLDRLTHGWKPGELIIVGARPAVGKTSFALECALAAVEMGPVVFVSLEMTTKQLRRRLLARESQVNLWWVRDAASQRTYASRLQDAAKQLTNIPLRLADQGQTPAEIRLVVEQYATEAGEPVRLVVVDYLQLMRSGRRASNRNEEIGDISRDLARMAIDLNVPVMALSQFSRDPAKQGRKPTMHDLRDSGAIEQDASLIVLLHTPTDQPEPLRMMQPDTYLVEVVVEKNRHGATGNLTMQHNRGIGHWSCVTQRAYAGAA